MNSELEILKKIWENKEGSCVRLISNQTGFGIDYVRYICNCLLNKRKLKSVRRKRDWYKITPQGKKELKLPGIIKPKISKKLNKVEKIRNYFFPKKIKLESKKSNFQEINIKKPKGNLIFAEEKNLNFGKAVEKAAAFLTKI